MDSQKVQSESKAWSFLPVNLIFIFHGFTFNLKHVTDTGRRNFCKIIFRVFFWLCLPLSAFCDLSKSTKPITTFILSQLYLTVILQQLLLLSKRHEIDKFISDLSGSLTKRQRLTFTLISTVVVIKILISVVYFVFYRRSVEARIARYFFLSPSSPFAGSIATVISTLEYLIIDPDWTSISLYLLTAFLVYFYIRGQIETLILTARMGNERVMMDLTAHITQTLASFEDIFSFLPLISLSANFSWAVFLLATFFDLPSDQRPAYLIFLIFHYLCVFLTLLSISLLSENIQKQRSLIANAHREATNGLRMMNCTLSKAVDEATCCRFTVWKITRINRSFIFSYIGTIVSFSTLIFQFKIKMANSSTKSSEHWQS